MAEQDIKVKDLNALILYNSKFREFYATVYQHMRQLRNAMQQTLDECQRMMREVKREHEHVRQEVRDAREEFNHLSSLSGQIDYSLISESRRRLDHIEGHVYQVVMSCEGTAWSHLSTIKTRINLLGQCMQWLETNFPTYVERGSKFLNLVTQHIEEYQKTQVNTNQS